MDSFAKLLQLPDSDLLRDIEANPHLFQLCGKLFMDSLQQLVCLLGCCFLPDKTVFVRIRFDLCAIYESRFKAEQSAFVQQNNKLTQNILPCLLGQNILSDTIFSLNRPI